MASVEIFRRTGHSGRLLEFAGEVFNPVRPASTALSTQNENVLFCKVEISYPFFEGRPAIPLAALCSIASSRQDLLFGTVTGMTAPGRAAEEFP